MASKIRGTKDISDLLGKPPFLASLFVKPNHEVRTADIFKPPSPSESFARLAYSVVGQFAGQTWLMEINQIPPNTVGGRRLRPPLAHSPTGPPMSALPPKADISISLAVSAECVILLAAGP